MPENLTMSNGFRILHGAHMYPGCPDAHPAEPAQDVGERDQYHHSIDDEDVLQQWPGEEPGVNPFSRAGAY